MNELISLLGIAIALGVGVVSPGPSFLMIARTAAAQGRSGGLRAAFGMGVGALVFASASLLGLSAAFAAVPLLYAAFKIIGGLYLAYLGFRIWRGAAQPLAIHDPDRDGDAGRKQKFFLLGLATQVSNPKTAIVYASVFATFMPQHPTWRFGAALIALVFVMETSWYAAVATLLSAQSSRNTYLRCKKWIDRSAGGIMGALGLKLASSAATQ